MKDKELLELAAMAVGPKVIGKVECSGGFELVELSSGLRWNPLEDDGAALRLAVQTEVFTNPLFFHWWRDVMMFTKNTPNAEATRRAIVRAAAEIGKSMQP